MNKLYEKMLDLPSLTVGAGSIDELINRLKTITAELEGIKDKAVIRPYYPGVENWDLCFDMECVNVIGDPAVKGHVLAFTNDKAVATTHDFEPCLLDPEYEYDQEKIEDLISDLELLADKAT